MKDIVRNTYDKIAEKYAASRGAFNNDAHLEKFSSVLPTGATVLDVGCGSGVPVDSFLVSRGFKVIGLDISEKQIELARTKVPEAKYLVRDISELTAGEFSVNAVVSFYAIFHTPRETHADLFKKFNSYLPANGLMLVTMASTEWEGVENDFYGEPMYESHYGPNENSELVRSAGFEIISDEIDSAGGEAHQVIFAKKAS
jgi:cyclopropane fatty-acyl-phospholipid synthase-like methyltransferase